MRDVSKIISDADLLKLRQLLAQTHLDTTATGPDAFRDYPKMLFHPEWLTLYRLIKDHPDPLVQKEAKQKLPSVQVIVTDIETEEEYLADDWRADPNEFIVADNEAKGSAHPDPRVPSGREGRRSRVSQQQAAQQELAALRRRYAELTGRKLMDEATTDVAPVEAAEPPEPAPAPRQTRPSVPAPAPTSKRERVAQAARRAVAARV